jgi:hypothetical protein
MNHFKNISSIAYGDIFLKNAILLQNYRNYSCELAYNISMKKFLTITFISLGAILLLIIFVSVINNQVEEPIPPTSEALETPETVEEEKTYEEIIAEREEQKTAFYASKGEGGPWENSLSLAWSSDKETFQESITSPTTLIEHGGVPSIIVKDDGTVIAAYQYFPANEEEFDKIAVSFGAYEGSEWTPSELIEIENYPEDLSRPFDPTLTLTKNGNIRLYFTANTKTKKLTDQVAIYSALSEDGIHYTFEPGARYRSSSGDMTIDAAAVLYNGIWHLYTPAMPNKGVNHVISTDGLNFEEQEQILTDDGRNWTGNVLVVDGKMRFYGASSKGIWFAESEDGFTWSEPIYTNIDGGDPAIGHLSNSDRLIMLRVVF